MKKRISQQRVVLVLVLLLLAILLTGCDGTGPKTRKPAGDFSRGIPLSEEAIGPPEMSVDSAGELIRVVIPVLGETDQTAFRYIQIDQEGRIVLEKDLDLDLGAYVRNPLLVENNQALHIVWAARDSSTEGWNLFHAIIDSDTDVISPPKPVSQGTERVSQFEATGDSLGNLTIAWEDNDTGSIWLTRISSTGSILTGPQVAVIEGEYPTLIADMGTLHMAWMEGESLQYTRVSEDATFPLRGQHLTLIQVARGNRMDGPVIGVDGDNVYLFWSILRQVGLEAGTAISEYLVIKEDDLSRLYRGVIPILPMSEDLLAPYQGPLALSLLVPAPPEEYMTTDFVLNPQTLAKSAPGAQVVAVSANQAMRLDIYTQIVLCVFESEYYQGCTIGSWTMEISQNPIIAADDGGNLHLLWQEGHSAKRVFYATTTPDAKTRFDRVSLADLPTLFLAGGMEAITGILLFPFALPWMAIGFVIMIVLRITRNDENITQRLSQILLILALVAYQVSKLLFLPDILIYVPFSAWLDIPEKLGMIFKIIVPIIIIGLGIAVAEGRRRRRQSDSPMSSLAYYITAVLVDIVLTLSIYGVIFMGEY